LLVREKWPAAAALTRSQRFDAGRFFEFVRDHSVAKHLYCHLRDNGRLSLLPEGPAEQLRSCHTIRKKNGDRLIGELLELQAHLEDGGVEAIFFKGPLLSLRYYGSENRRRFWDLDLLLRDRRDLAQCDHILVQLGFRRRSKTPFGDRVAMWFVHAFDYVRRDEPVPTIVDLHWTLSNHFTFRLDDSRLWTTTESCVLRGRSLRTLSAEYELVQLMLAVLRDTERGRLRAKLLIDLFMVLRSVDEKMDWPRFFSARRAEGLKNISKEVLDLTLDMLDCRDDLPGLARSLEDLPGRTRQGLEHGLRLIEGSQRVLRNKLWAFRLYRGGVVPALVWWAVSLPVKMAVFRS